MAHIQILVVSNSGSSSVLEKSIPAISTKSTAGSPHRFAGSPCWIAFARKTWHVRLKPASSLGFPTRSYLACGHPNAGRTSKPSARREVPRNQHQVDYTHFSLHRKLGMDAAFSLT